MKTKFLFLFLLAFLFNSCQDELNKELTVRMITSSKLTVKVVDGNGTAIPNVKIKLYDRAILSSSSSSTYSSLQYIAAANTDASGKVDFGEVTTGTYFILIDSVRINNLNYQPIMQFQMNSAADKEITINPEDYATTFNFNFSKIEASATTGMFTVSDFNDLNILLIPSSAYSINNSLDKLLLLAEVITKTNDVGKVSLKIPAFRSYVPIVYNEAKTVFSVLNYNNDYYSYLSGDKDATTNLSFTLDAKTLNSITYGIYKLTLKKIVQIPTSTSPVQTPFDGLNVAAIPYSSYDSNAPLSILLQSAESTGKTDLNGNISFLLSSGKNYMLVVYNNDKTVSAVLSSSVYVNSGETRQASFSISSTTLSPVVYSNLYVTISKTSSVYYTSNPTDLTPYSNLDVVLVPYLSTNSTSSIDDLLSKAVASGKTNASGQVLFVLGLSTSYNYSYYQIVAYNTEKTAKFTSSSFSIYPGNSSSYSYMLNSTTLTSVN